MVQISKANKNNQKRQWKLAKAYQYTAFSCFTVDKLLPRTLKNSTPEEQTERKNDRFETPRLRDSSKSFWDFEIGPKFSETHVSFSRYHSIPLLWRSAWRSFALICYRKITVLLCEQAAIRNDFRAGVLKSYTIKCIDIWLQGKSR